jgi:hypothetical protein
VRVPAALVRNSTTTGTCSSVRFAPSPFTRVTVVVHPSLSAVLFFTRSSEWHEAQAVLRGLQLPHPALESGSRAIGRLG